MQVRNTAERMATEPRVVAGFAVAFMAAFAILMRAPGSTVLLAGVAYHVATLAAVVLSARAARRATGELRLGWRAMTVAAVMWAGAEGYFAIHAFRGTDAPFPSIADGLYFTGYIALIIAIPLVAGMPRGLRNPRLLLDGAIVVIAAAAFYWQYLIQPASSDSTASSFVATAYPVLDLTVLSFVVLAFYGIGRQLSVQALLVVAAGIILVATDSFYSASVLNATTVPALSVLDLGWLSVYWLIAIAAVSPTVEPRTKLSRSPWVVPALPYLVTLPLVADAAAGLAQGQAARGLSAGALGAVLALLVRQWITMRDNQRLLARERALTSSLEEAIENLEQLRAEAEYIASHDHLTSLLNRRAWEAAASDTTPTAVAVLDIDHFKTVNDVFGHLAGDDVLRTVSSRLREHLPGASIGRLGGEEFGVLFSAPFEEALASLDRALEAIASEPCTAAGNQPIRVTLSAGVVPWMEATDRSRALERAYAMADRELYAAKASGRAAVQQSRPQSVRRQGAA